MSILKNSFVHVIVILAYEELNTKMSPVTCGDIIEANLKPQYNC